MYILHWEYMAGSIVVHAMLEEIQPEYDLRHVDMAGGEHTHPEYLSKNPVGRVPALTLPDGSTIGETGAIVILLGETFPQSEITPLPGDEDRSVFLFWLNVMVSAGYPTVTRLGHPERYAFTSDAIAEVKRQCTIDLDCFFDLMEGAIKGEVFFLKQGFSALDYYLAMLIGGAPDQEKLFATHPKIKALFISAIQRPAYKKAMQTHATPEQAA